MPAVLGLDLGTSQVKALLRDTDGTVLGQGTAGYPVSVPQPGWAEADPGQWWQAACAAVRAAAGTAGDQVTAVAVAGQMHGVVLSAERNVVLRPAITWLDRRATGEAADYQRLPADLRAALGNAPSPGIAGPVLLWLSRHEPGRYQQARWALQPKDWLRQQLTGGLEAVTDPTDASGTLLFDVRRGTWSGGVAAALGLRTGLLPAIRPPAEVAGLLSASAAGPARPAARPPGRHRRGRHRRLAAGRRAAARRSPPHPGHRRPAHHPRGQAARTGRPLPRPQPVLLGGRRDLLAGRRPERRRHARLGPPHARGQLGRALRRGRAAVAGRHSGLPALPGRRALGSSGLRRRLDRPDPGPPAR